MRNQLRKWVFGVLLVAGVSLAPSAFARSHVSVGVGINLPGISIGVSNWGHGGYAHGGYGWGGNYAYPAAYPAYYGGYYQPAYYSSYSYPVYYGPRYYGGSYYREAPVVRRSYYRDRDYGRDYDRDYGRRGHYYDRDGYYRR